MASILEDREAIRDVLLRACFYADMGEIDAHVNTLYTEDVVVEVKALGGSADDMIVNGRSGVAEFMRGAAKDGVPWRHYTMPLIVSVDHDAAIVKSYLLLVSSGTPWTVLDAAYYDDQMIRQNDGWRVHRRQILGQASQLEMF